MINQSMNKISRQTATDLFYGRTRTAYIWHSVCSGTTGWYFHGCSETWPKERQCNLHYTDRRRPWNKCTL